MAILGLQMFEGLVTVRTCEITPRVYLLVSEEVILGVKHLPADVTGIATLLMNLLGFSLTDCFTDITGQVTEGLIILTNVTIVSVYDRGRHRVTAVITGYCNLSMTLKASLTLENHFLDRAGTMRCLTKPRV